MVEPRKGGRDVADSIKAQRLASEQRGMHTISKKSIPKWTLPNSRSRWQDPLKKQSVLNIPQQEGQKDVQRTHEICKWLCQAEE